MREKKVKRQIQRRKDELSLLWLFLSMVLAAFMLFMPEPLTKVLRVILRNPDLGVFPVTMTGLILFLAGVRYLCHSPRYIGILWESEVPWP